ncbi:MAG: phage holin family protein [Paludibacteraceae bacterium]|nr:phage holin family protein [Paludibacteraceae bacterium]
MDNDFINQVQADASAYLSTRTLLGKLRIIGGVSRVLGLFLLVLTTVLLLFGFLGLCSVAAVLALGNCMPVWAAALVVGAAYVLLIILAFIFRKQLFINPFVKLLSGIFFEKEGRQIEELRLRKEAEND